MRVVYDASARSSGPSLNDCLYTGPKFNQKILDILLRFRTHRVTLTADIEKAFLMISMAEIDRDVLRFLWVENVVFGADDEESAYKVYTDSKEMLKSGSFNLWKFITNSLTLQEKINNAEGLATTGYQDKQSSDLNETYAKSILGSTQQVQPGEQKTLGVSWNVASDRFLFNLNGIARLATELNKEEHSQSCWMVL